MRKIYATSLKLFTLTAEALMFVSTCDVFNYLFPLDVQSEIQLISKFGWHRFLCVRGFKKTQATVAFLASFQELNLEW